MFVIIPDFQTVFLSLPPSKIILHFCSCSGFVEVKPPWGHVSRSIPRYTMLSVALRAISAVAGVTLYIPEAVETTNRPGPGPKKMAAGLALVPGLPVLARRHLGPWAGSSIKNRKKNKSK